jgi:NAD(P)H dehydrogenase (quinone)
MTKHIIVAYHSGYGHTAKVANHVQQGAASVGGVNAVVLDVTTITEADWQALDAADGIIFGCPTYMGGVSAAFKTFIDATGLRWMQRKWVDKIAAGFTNSSGLNGDKQVVLQQLFTTAMQHGMIWVGQNEMNPNAKGTDSPSPQDVNRLGSFSGLMTQSNNESADIVPPAGDLATAVLFGKRVADAVMRWQR